MGESCGKTKAKMEASESRTLSHYTLLDQHHDVCVSDPYISHKTERFEAV